MTKRPVSITRNSLLHAPSPPHACNKNVIIKRLTWYRFYRADLSNFFVFFLRDRDGRIFDPLDNSHLRNGEFHRATQSFRRAGKKRVFIPTFPWKFYCSKARKRIYTADAKVSASVKPKVPKCATQKTTGPSGRIIYAIIDVIAFEYSQLCARRRGEGRGGYQ